MTDFKFEVWPTEFREVNQYFGVNPQNYAQFGLPGHEGIDFKALDGSQVFAVAPGTVSSVRTDPNGHNYGIHVRIDHVDKYQTTYAHLRQAVVSPGQQVAAGALLGLADNTGNSFGSHLHLTLKKLDATFKNWPFNITDPTPFLLPLLGWKAPAGPFVDGFVYTAGLTLGDGLAQANAGGVNLRGGPSSGANLIALVPAGTIMSVSGAPSGDYTPVKVPRAAVGLPDSAAPPKPAPPPPATTATADGWAIATGVSLSGDQAVVGALGINLRAQAQRTAAMIGLVKGGSTVAVLGAQQGEYLPVRVRLVDFTGPVSLPDPVPAPAASATPPTTLPEGVVQGWSWTQNMTITGRQASIGKLGINLRASPDQASAKVALVKEGALVTVIGPARGDYTPIWARLADALDLVSPLPAVTPPGPFPADAPPPSPPAQPLPSTTPGWVFTAGTVFRGTLAEAGTYGLNMRDAPRRDARAIGFVPAGASLLVAGPAQGEYTPVRIDDHLLQAPLPAAAAPAAAAPAAAAPAAPADPDPPMLGNCLIGLHASADPEIGELEFQEFIALRPGLIKVLSFHSEQAIRRLAQSAPDASFIVRAFLDFGGRVISPDQFVNDTLPDVRRALGALAGHDVVIELHNEPNVNAEGLGTSWADGAAFAAWWQAVLAKYRQALPGQRFLYPGLAPVGTVINRVQDYIQFFEASRAAVDAADGLGVHFYWSSVFPLEKALEVLDGYIARVRFKHLWVTEASNNKAGTSVPDKGKQYLQCWHELQRRPTVQGITFFVASASNPDFAEEVWVGRGLGAIVGKR